METLESVSIVLMQLLQSAEESKNEHDFTGSVGEVEINGANYQIQLGLVRDEKMFIPSDQIREQECVKYEEMKTDYNVN